MTPLSMPEPGSRVPEVSVVLIFKDEEDFLAEAIESVRSQTFGDWELLLVDDGSTDRSTTIARSYAEHDQGRVRYLDHPGHENRGMSAARNLGASHARGELIAFLDADDALLPTALEHQVELLRAHPSVGMVYGPLEYWYGWTGDPEDEARDFVYSVGVPTDRVYEPPSLIALFIQNIAFAPSGMLLRRALVEQVGGFEESFRDLHEDQVFAAKVCREASVYVSGRCTYRYRQHPNSCCMRAERKGQVDASRYAFLRWLVGYLEREGLAGGEAWQLARAELRERFPPWRRLAAFADPQRLRRIAAGLGGAGARGR